MKAKILGLLLAFLAGLMTLSGCAQVNPGPVSTRTYQLTGFNRVEVGSAFEVQIVRSDTWSVNITAQEKLFDHVHVEVVGDRLEVNLDWNWGSWISNWSYKRPVARITLPELNGLVLSGASKGSVAGFASRPVDINVSGASSLQLDMQASMAKIEVSGASRVEGSLNAVNVTAEVTGASRCKLTGMADSLVLKASGASNGDLEGFTIKTLDVELSGASHATVAPLDTMKVSISGASSLTYRGEPKLQAIEVSGASTISQKK